MTRTASRLLAVTSLSAGLLLAAAAPATAQIPVPDIPGVDIPGAVGDAVSDQLCPGLKPPTPRSPAAGMPWSQPGGQTQFQQYGYGGLQITTHDQGCVAQISTISASAINEVANSLDELVNAAQVAAVSDTTTSPIDMVLPRALRELRDTFWTPWMPVVAVFGGVLILLLGLMARSTAATVVGLNLLLVLGLVPWLLGNSQVVTGISDSLTSAVAQQTSDGLLRMQPSTAGDTAAAAYGDGYYQVAWRAHVEQSFGSHTTCAEKYAPELVKTKAFSYDEQALLATSSSEFEAALVQAKGQRWLELADQMKAEFPACYATWAAPDGAWSAVMKHLVVSLFAGGWLLLLGLAVLALRYLLRFGLLIAAGFGLVALIQQKMTAALTGIMLAGLIGPPLMSLAAGAMMFWFYVVITDPATAWWQAIVSGVALGVGALLALKWLGGALIGFVGVGAARGIGKRGRGRFHNPIGGSTARRRRRAAAGALLPRAQDPDRHEPVGFRKPKSVDAAKADADADYTPPGRRNVDTAAPTTEAGSQVIDGEVVPPATSTDGPASDASFIHDRPPPLFPDLTDPLDPDAGDPPPRWLTDGATGVDGDRQSPPPTPIDLTAADQPSKEPAMTAVAQSHDPVDGYVPGTSHPVMPAPSRDIVDETWQRYAGPRARPAIGDEPPADRPPAPDRAPPAEQAPGRGVDVR